MCICTYILYIHGMQHKYHCWISQQGSFEFQVAGPVAYCPAKGMKARKLRNLPKSFAGWWLSPTPLKNDGLRQMG